MALVVVTHLVPGKPQLGASVGDGTLAFIIEPECSVAPAPGKKKTINRYTLRLTSSEPLLLAHTATIELALRRAVRHMLELTNKHVGKHA